VAGLEALAQRILSQARIPSPADARPPAMVAAVAMTLAEAYQFGGGAKAGLARLAINTEQRSNGWIKRHLGIPS